MLESWLSSVHLLGNVIGGCSLVIFPNKKKNPFAGQLSSMYSVGSTLIRKAGSGTLYFDGAYLLLEHMTSYPSTSELFESWRSDKPESKLELIDGRLIVGNSLMGSRLLLRQILQGWRAAAAIALAPTETWLAALAAGYGAHLPDTDSWDIQLDSLEVQLAEFAFVPEDLRAGGASQTWSHYQVWQQLTMDLFRLNSAVGGQSLGRDFVMRLGNDGFTPDLLFFKSQSLNQLHEAFLSGPAELVVEIMMPGIK